MPAKNSSGLYHRDRTGGKGLFLKPDSGAYGSICSLLRGRDAGEILPGDAGRGHAQQEVRAGHGEAGGGKPEGQLDDEGREEIAQVHDEAVGRAALTVRAQLYLAQPLPLKECLEFLSQAGARLPLVLRVHRSTTPRIAPIALILMPPIPEPAATARLLTFGIVLREPPYVRTTQGSKALTFLLR